MTRMAAHSVLWTCAQDQRVSQALLAGYALDGDRSALHLRDDEVHHQIYAPRHG